MRLAWVVAGAIAALFPALSQANDKIVRYQRAAPAGIETVIGIGVRWNKDCQGTGIPTVNLDLPPEHGFVCVRIGLVKPQSMLIGAPHKCLNKPMQGAQIVYRPHAAYVGDDRIRYTLKFPRVEQSYGVLIIVRHSADKQISPNFSPSSQQRGAMPECAALIS